MKRYRDPNPPRCPKCDSAKLRLRGDGLVRCYGCGGDNLPEKLVRRELRTTFKCGHPKTKENMRVFVVDGTHYCRCKLCHQAKNRRFFNPEKPLLPVYVDARDHKTLLEQVWV